MINCTGPDTDLARVDDPFVQRSGRGLIRPDPLGLGLDTDEDGRLVDAEGARASGCSSSARCARAALGEHRRAGAARRSPRMAELLGAD